MNEIKPLKPELKELSRDNLEKLVERFLDVGILSSDELSKELNHIRAGTKTVLQSVLPGFEPPRVEQLPLYSEELINSNIEAPRRRLSVEQVEALLKTLQVRFEKNVNRKKRGMSWAKVQSKLLANPEKMWSLNEMEKNGHEPDVVVFDAENGEYLFYSCSAEAPENHRYIAYDRAAEEWFRANKPNEKCNGNAVDIAVAMGVEILDNYQYRRTLQNEHLSILGGEQMKYDTNSWSWLKTPEEARSNGVALFGISSESQGGLGVCAVQRTVSDCQPNGGFRAVVKV